MRPHESVSALYMLRNGFGKQQGLTLVELMVALTIGLLIGLVVTQAYVSGVTTQRSQNDMTRLQESARFAFGLLTKEIRNAGYRNTYTPGSGALEFCRTSAAGSAVEGANDPATLNLGESVTATILNKSDSITVRYYGEDNAAGTAADGAVLDCLGNPVRRATLVVETLYVAADPANNNEPTLYCSSRTTALGPLGAPTVTPMIAGIETLQLLYGDDTDVDGVVNRYIPYSKVAASSTPDNANSVMVSFVVRSQSPVKADSAAQTFDLFGATYAANKGTDTGSTFAAPADSRIRLPFSSVIAMRNFPRCE